MGDRDMSRQLTSGVLGRKKILPVMEGLVLYYSANRQKDADILIDLSGNKINANPKGVNKADLIENEYNGSKTLRFNGNTNYITDQFDEISQPNTVIFVGKNEELGDLSFVYDGVDGFRHVAYQAANSVWLFGAGIYPAPPPFPARSDNTNLMLSLCEFNTDSSKYYENNVLRYVQNWGTESLKAIIIGSRFSDTQFMNGDISEFIVYNRLLTNEERDIISNFLMQKYNL